MLRNTFVAFTLIAAALAGCNSTTSSTGDDSGVGGSMAPLVRETSPERSAEMVGTDSPVVATFDQPMDASTIDDSTFYLTDVTGSHVAADISYEGTTAVLRPHSLLPISLGLTATLTTGVHAANGSALSSAYTWTFTTGTTTCAEVTSNLRSAGSYAVLAGTMVSASGATSVTGDVGVSPGTQLLGLVDSAVDGTIHVSDSSSATAMTDLGTTYADLTSRSLCPSVPGADLGGRLLGPGLYTVNSALAISGNLTLDARGDSSAVFVFRTASSLTTAASSHVTLAGGARAANVFWQVGSSAVLGEASSLTGTIVAHDSITMHSGAMLTGRALAQTGSVTLDGATVSNASL